MSSKKTKSRTVRRRTTQKRKGRRSPKRHSSKTKPLWTPEAGITYSALLRFSRNPEEFARAYVEGWTSKRLSVPLEFGTIWHLCEEAAHRYSKFSPEGVVSKVLGVYERARKPHLRQEDDYELNRIFALIKAEYPSYCSFWEREDRGAGRKWIGREVLFDEAHSFPAGPMGMASINLRGKIDGVYRDPYGHLGIRETKTKGQINPKEISEYLASDFQTLMYVYALYLKHQEYPTSCSYNVVRRPGLIHKKGESFKDFTSRVKKDIEDRPSHYFHRWNVTYKREDVQAFVSHTLNPVLLLLNDWWRSVEENPFDRTKSLLAFQNLNGLWTKYGKVDLFNLMMFKSTVDLYQRDSVFPELLEEFKL